MPEKLNDCDYSCGPRPRHVRPTLSKPPASRYTAPGTQRFPRYSTNYDGGVAFFSDVPAVRRPTDNYTRTPYAAPTPSRFILWSTFSALQGVTRIPRRRGNRCYPRRVLLIADRWTPTDLVFATLPSWSPTRSFHLARDGPSKYRMVCRISWFISDFFFMLRVVSSMGVLKARLNRIFESNEKKIGIVWFSFTPPVNCSEVLLRINYFVR